MNELHGGEGEEAGAYVVEHDAGAGGEAFQLPDWGRFEGDVEEAEEQEREDGVGPSRVGKR